VLFNSASGILVLVVLFDSARLGGNNSSISQGINSIIITSPDPTPAALHRAEVPVSEGGFRLTNPRLWPPKNRGFLECGTVREAPPADQPSTYLRLPCDSLALTLSAGKSGVKRVKRGWGRKDSYITAKTLGCPFRRETSTPKLAQAGPHLCIVQVDTIEFSEQVEIFCEGLRFGNFTFSSLKSPNIELRH
jgi:hypothetical protein